MLIKMSFGVVCVCDKCVCVAVHSLTYLRKVQKTSGIMLYHVSPYPLKMGSLTGIQQAPGNPVPSSKWFAYSVCHVSARHLNSGPPAWAANTHIH